MEEVEGGLVGGDGKNMKSGGHAEGGGDKKIKGGTRGGNTSGGAGGGARGGAWRG